MGRRGFGYIRRLPSKRYQASYTGPDLARHVGRPRLGRVFGALPGVAVLTEQVST
jgi:hypothetical protein